MTLPNPPILSTTKPGPTSFDVPKLLQAYNSSLAMHGANFDLARYILKNAQVDWSKYGASSLNQNLGKSQGSGVKHPSTISRIFDILMRPTYASAETARQLVMDPEPGQDFVGQSADVIGGFLSGLTGKEKTTYSKVIKQFDPEFAKEHKILTGALGFAGDILLDPTTYIGVGAVKGVGKGIGRGIGKVVGREAAELPPQALTSLTTKFAPKGLDPSTGLLNLATNKAGAPKLPKLGGTVGIPQAGDVSALPLGLRGRSPKPGNSRLIESITGGRPPVANLATSKAVPSVEIPEKAARASIEKLSTEEILKNIEKLGITYYPGKSSRDDIIKRFMEMQEERGISALVEAFPRKTPVKSAIARKAIEEASELSSAQKAAEKYFNSTLSKPNKFSATAKTYNPAQQANFFQNKLLVGEGSEAVKILRGMGIRNPHSPKFVAKRFSLAYRMLKVAEQHFEAKGITPSFWDGSAIKLSDVIEAVGGPKAVTNELYTQLLTAFRSPAGLSKISNPKIRQAIESLQAQNAIKDAPQLRLALDQTVKHAAVADQVLSDSKYKAFLQEIQKNQSKMLKEAGASPVTQKAATKLTTQIFKTSQTLPQVATNAHSKTILGYVIPGQKGIKWAPVGNAQTNAIAQAIGVETPAALGTKIGALNKAVEMFGGHMTTWYGQKDLRPDALIKIASAMNNASVRAQKWNKIAKTYSPEQINASFKAAQGVPQLAGAPPELVGEFKKSIEELYKSSGLSDEANAAASVALRSGLLMHDINKQLKYAKSEFRFTNTQYGKRAITGDDIDFSKGTDWLNSWQMHEVKDPLSFMMHLETATEQVMHQYAFMDELAARFGSRTRGGPFSTPVASLDKSNKALGQSRLLGVYFPKDIAEQTQRVFSTWNQIYDPKSSLVQFIDKVTSAWKSGVTIYAPSHHIRNFVGDVYLAWLSGVNNPRVYLKAQKIMRAQHGIYSEGMVPIEQLIGKNAISSALTRPGAVILRTKGGVDLTAEQVYIAAHRTGLLSKAKVIEDIVGDPLIKWKPLGGHVQNFARNASEIREHYVRLAHFVDLLEKSGEKNLPRLFDEASKTVRKWHPDGMDLTQFERSTLRRVFPFYSWTRKTIPLIIEGSLTKPAKIVAYPKAGFNLQVAAGIESPSPSDPFPVDQLFPNWMREKGIGPILGSGNSGYDIINPSNPFNDIVAQFGGMGNARDPISGIGQMLNPLAKVPVELATGNTMLGTPVDYDKSRYFTEQVPLLANLSRLTNIDPTGVTERGEKQGVPNWAGILNFLTALGYIPTQNYTKQASFEQKSGRQ